MKTSSRSETELDGAQNPRRAVAPPSPGRGWEPGPRRSGWVTGLLAFAVSCLALGVLYWLAHEALKEAVREQLRILALGAAREVDVSMHEQLQDKSQMGTPLHLKALAPLVEYHKLFPNIIYLYTVRVQDGKQSFVLDTWYDREIAARRPGSL